MNLDRDSYAKSRPPVERKADPRALQQQVAIGIRTDNLVNSSEWDEFIAVLNGLQEWNEKQRGHFQDMLQSSDVSDPTEVARARQKVMVLTERISLLQFISDMPQEIIKNGAKAKELLDEYKSDKDGESDAIA